MFGWLVPPIFAVTNVVPDYVSELKSLPARHILLEDIVQDSIQLRPISIPKDISEEVSRLLRISTNSFVVRWKYTEEGAKRTLAFRETHQGQEVRTVIGDFSQTRCEIGPQSLPWPFVKDYAEWKQGWLERRTDEMIGVGEEDAKKIVAGLKGK